MCRIYGQVGPLNAQSNPEPHVQSPAFPHTRAHNILLWRYWTEYIIFSWSSGWKYGSPTQVVQQCSSRSSKPWAPSLNTASLLLIQALENAVKMQSVGKAGKSACVPGGAKSLMARQQKLSDAVQKQTWQNIPSECRHSDWNSCENLKKCAVRRSSWKKQRIKNFGFFMLRQLRQLHNKRFQKASYNFSNYLECFIINIYWVF